MVASFDTSSPWLKRLISHRAWILISLTVLLVLVVRVRLREMPLERDEGEYAYAGQLMLQGIPPYKEAYNMKLPGTYAAYAVIMAVFGQTPSAIHFGLALVNVASVVLVFLIGRKLLDDITGIVAAVVFALLSLSPSVFGLAAHATHFVTLFALAGIFVLLRAVEASRRSADIPVRSKLDRGGDHQILGTVEHSGVAESEQHKSGPRYGLDRNVRAPTLLFLAGLFFGLAFLMKQHGLFFGLFGGTYLVWIAVREWLASRDAGRRMRRRRGGDETSPFRSVPGIALFSLGFALPYLITCLVLWRADVFHQFIFWTISYARKYATNVPIAYAPRVLGPALTGVVGTNLGLWLLAGAGALLMWWEKRLTANHRFLIIALLVCSFASVSVGFHFRPHYFIPLLPVLALLCAVAVSRGVQLLKRDETIEPLLVAIRLAPAIPVLGLFIIGSAAALIGNSRTWFALSPAQAYWASYHSTLFPEAVNVADYIKAHSGSNARIAVIGSEPEIYFSSHRRSATGYIYTYALMEPGPVALKMQDEMIAEIERARPEWVVYINDDLSWQQWRDSERKIFDWWKTYWDKNLEMISMTPIKEGGSEAAEATPASNKAGDPKYMMLLKRR